MGLLYLIYVFVEKQRLNISKSFTRCSNMPTSHSQKKKSLTAHYSTCQTTLLALKINKKKESTQNYPKTIVENQVLYYMIHEARTENNIPADNPALSTPDAAEFATASQWVVSPLICKPLFRKTFKIKKNQLKISANNGFAISANNGFAKYRFNLASHEHQNKCY